MSAPHITTSTEASLNIKHSLEVATLPLSALPVWFYHLSSTIGWQLSLPPEWGLVAPREGGVQLLWLATSCMRRLPPFKWGSD